MLIASQLGAADASPHPAARATPRQADHPAARRRRPQHCILRRLYFCLLASPAAHAGRPRARRPCWARPSDSPSNAVVDSAGATTTSAGRSTSRPRARTPPGTGATGAWTYRPCEAQLAYAGVASLFYAVVCGIACVVAATMLAAGWAGCVVLRASGWILVLRPACSLRAACTASWSLRPSPASAATSPAWRVLQRLVRQAWWSAVRPGPAPPAAGGLHHPGGGPPATSIAAVKRAGSLQRPAASPAGRRRSARGGCRIRTDGPSSAAAPPRRRRHGPPGRAPGNPPPPPGRRPWPARDGSRAPGSPRARTPRRPRPSACPRPRACAHRGGLAHARRRDRRPGRRP